MAFAAGDVLGDRYVLRKTDWSSPLGPVWLARDRVLDRPVLVQELSAGLESDEQTVTTFQRAAARIAQVSHPSLLQVYDIGVDPPFAVLEHAGGGRLAERLAAGPMRHTDVARAALSIARGLEALHERGAWHGSLSPASVLFDEESRPKVLAVGAAETAVVAPSVNVRGEQPRSYRPMDPDPVPADADRYALAALTYQMLTGRPPDRGVRVRTLRRQVPQAMDDLLMRALDSDPAVRPAGDEFISALAPFARIEPPEPAGPRIRFSELGWLVPVVVIVGLAIAAATVGVQLVKNLGEREEKPRESPTATAGGRGLPVASVRDFDPPPGNGEETPRRVRLAIDGDARTSWHTVGYSNERLGGAKPGVGLLFDLGDSVGVARARIQSTLPGWKAEVRVADTEGGRADGYRTVTTFTAAVDNTLSLPSGTRARFVLIWITRLADDESGDEFPYEADISEAEFFAR